MELESRFGKVIVEEVGNSISEVKIDYTKDKSAVNKGGFKSTLYKALTILIKSEPVKKILIIGSYNAGTDNLALVDEGNLIVLLNAEIYVINLACGEIVNYVVLGEFFPLWSIYNFDDGYIIHGELEIIKLNKDFEIEWSFSGSDIFVNPSDSREAFEIQGNTIQLIDWNGEVFRLDKDGNELSYIKQ